MVVGKQESRPTSCPTERHGYDPTSVATRLLITPYPPARPIYRQQVEDQALLARQKASPTPRLTAGHVQENLLH
ncbi:hypothetical protein, partial [Enterococcus faecalis]|uniref:hypothetical protein n=1 Tax=Enterococcus faecalis TaxID=1351 RepID=UPI003D6BEDA6